MEALRPLTPDALRDLGAFDEEVELFAQWLAARGWTSVIPTPRNLTDAARYGLNAYWLVYRLKLTTCFIDDEGARVWHVRGLVHRDDGPAIEHADGSREWYRYGLRHRDDGPAIEWPDGFRAWYRRGLAHRIDGPAKEYADGTREWYRYGRLHREDGPAVEYADGRVEYWVRGLIAD